MSNHNGFQKISYRDAFALIGLHNKNESTFQLANMIIEIEEGGLKITYLSSSKSASPDQIQHTDEPFSYTHDKINYLIANEDGELVVYEEEQSIGN